MNAIRVPVSVAGGSARSAVRARPWLRAVRAVAIAAALCVAVAVAVEVALRAGHVAQFVFPAPSAVLRDLVSEPGLYLHATLVTLAEAAAGLALGTVVALAFAAAALHSRLLDRALTPIVVASQTVPVIALAPLLVLWLGYGALPRVVVCALIAFFPLAVTSLQGLRATDPRLLLLLRSVDARPWDVFWRVRVPSAAPYFTAGLRTGATLSLVGAVVAEWTGSDAGLGYLVLSANARLATAQAFAAILLITALGLAAYGVVAALERKACWWDAAPATASPRKGR
jgi:ABC-type nitrate/sulfonate/bicarbonate transport system permease component